VYPEAAIKSPAPTLIDPDEPAARDTTKILQEMIDIF
jgi:hypothetical protein